MKVFQKHLNKIAKCPSLVNRLIAKVIRTKESWGHTAKRKESLLHLPTPAWKSAPPEKRGGSLQRLSVLRASQTLLGNSGVSGGVGNARVATAQRRGRKERTEKEAVGREKGKDSKREGRSVRRRQGKGRGGRVRGRKGSGRKVEGQVWGNEVQRVVTLSAALRPTAQSKPKEKDERGLTWKTVIWWTDRSSDARTGSERSTSAEPRPRHLVVPSGILEASSQWFMSWGPERSKSGKDSIYTEKGILGFLAPLILQGRRYSHPLIYKKSKKQISFLRLDN